MKSFLWGLALALALGFGLGLAYTWLATPLRVIDSAPSSLRADFKDQYRASIAAAFAADGNLPRATARLALLDDENNVETLNSQAQRLTAAGDFTLADQVAVLAAALNGGTTTIASDSPAAAPSPNNLALQPPTTLPPTPVPPTADVCAESG